MTKTRLDRLGTRCGRISKIVDSPIDNAKGRLFEVLAVRLKLFNNSQVMIVGVTSQSRERRSFQAAAVILVLFVLLRSSDPHCYFSLPCSFVNLQQPGPCLT